MNADWDRITELFAAARALDPDARRAFLDAVAAGNLTLREQLDSLLGADTIQDDFLEPPPTAVIAAALRHGTDPLLPGLLLKDRYIVEERLASGGQALVYRATDRTVGRPVVVKVMRAEHGEGAMLRDRFEQEKRALATVDHPAVVGILDVGTLDDGSPFLVLQFIRGVSLRELIGKGTLDQPRALRIVQGIAAGLSAAHAAGVAHYDLKPENVMVQQSPDGAETIKLIDFGLAKLDRTGLPPSLTTVMIAGSVRYMAPEQFEGRNVPASDVFALGMIACELLYGHPDVRAVHASAAVPVRRLLQDAVAFHPEDRPGDIREWAGRLGDAACPPRRRGYLSARALAAAALVLVATAALVGLTQDRGANERIVEKVGAFDPVHEGFQVHGTIRGTVVPTPGRTALMGWSLTTGDAGGGFYFHPLSRAQKRRALARGWTLTTVMQPTKGGGSTVVDFGSEGRRFDINVFAEPAAYLVRLNTQIVPTFQGLEIRLPRAAPAYHKYELRFDQGLDTADLYVDGEKRLSGYRGHTQFQEQTYGLMFGAAPVNSEEGAASFLSVRFEIAP